MEEKDTSVCRKAKIDGEMVEMQAFRAPLVPSHSAPTNRNECNSQRTQKVHVCIPKHHERLI